MKKTITVIVPVYDVEPYLDRCVRSILDQTYPHLQVILVDDGSTDGSGAICDHFARQDSRVQVIHKANGGPMSARKAGIEKAEGEYIGFMDGDDYIDSNMYEMMLKHLVDTGSDFVQAGHVLELESGESLTCLPREQKCFDNFDKCEIIADYILSAKAQGIATDSMWSKLYRRHLVMKCYEKVPDGLSEDEDTLFNCHGIFVCNRFAIKKSAYYHHTMHAGSLSYPNRDSMAFARIGDAYRCLRNAFEQYGCFKKLSKKLDELMIDRILYQLIPMGKERGILHAPSYCYPNIEELSGKRIVIYGAGYVGQDYYAQICKQPSCEIVALADTYPKECRLEHIKVQRLYDLNTLKFDVILIAVLDRNVMMEIRDSLIDIGVPSHKITWEKPELVVQ